MSRSITVGPIQLLSIEYTFQCFILILIINYSWEKEKSERKAALQELRLQTKQGRETEREVLKQSFEK